MADRERMERLARNEVHFRDINESLDPGGAEERGAARGLLEFVCECSKLTCTETVRLSAEEYEHVRGDPSRFAIVPGHDFPETERVTGTFGRYAVVEKFDAVDHVVGAADPERD